MSISKCDLSSLKVNILNSKIVLLKHVKWPFKMILLDGASCCGVFCALSNILQSQMLYEEINIFTTISQLQKRRPEFINSYVCNMSCAYILKFELKSNYFTDKIAISFAIYSLHPKITQYAVIYIGCTCIDKDKFHFQEPLYSFFYINCGKSLLYLICNRRTISVLS
ncbi:hypothetical protein KUTeg_006219 [Tegillarca granosa]|uniref:Uncharacterized protein n=1 Tax=Tegillarca granosa TaxID=220873 RepID=A0ABQ9FFY6_TEGGR|nr:hypothetical protein KUTeg_006219 [Tegillarca granosa]